MLLTLDKVLSEAELALIHQLLAQSDWASGLSSAGAQAAQVKNNQQLPENAPHLAQLRQIILTALQREPLFFSAALPLQILPPYFNCYTGMTNAYGLHTDNALRPYQGGYVRTDVSVTVFLTEPDQYEGGELVITDTYGEHNIKLAAGSIVVYPSSSIHEVRPVTRGARLACFMFMQSMVRSAEHRRLLFDMDMQLLSLRQQIGDTPEVVRLTGIYHNLLRCWGEN
jgi:PKHD-type hydroxylase